ncbi:MAG: RnfABCDGE type electron transport complex subunit D [Bacteroidetes bacterium]|nr:RnfABCDGE type electron transport complex subunit D [Bacteroidota bacterium]MBU1579728.1 RnfABCDGE type electron transport complex subunit D [Bacteroidota bacterium]MBU2466741.1 RnfABCDGE type electron transport complex subunit D [Bacteroidota bacterium]MBU2556400.1 RnfABCDGE type electron transport complex subunit D [Bacteroidota bacterium]
MMNQFTISGSPHVHGEESVSKVMYTVVLALVPAVLVSSYFFGLDAVRVLLIAVLSCLFFEWAIQKYIIKGPITITDGSAVVAGLLLAFNVPANLPWWILVIGALVTIGIAKMSFGGLGKNPFNPALVGRVFMLISFPVQMTSWPVAKPLFADAVTDAVTGPTALGLLKEGIDAGKTVEQILSDPNMPAYLDRLTGNMSGSLGEMSAIALLLGGLFMIWRKVIDWQVPFSIIFTVFAFAGIFHLIDPTYYIDPTFHLFTGGLMLGAIYMATDMVSSPMTITGKWIYGIGIGLITIIIRLWGAYPEGISFAILIMNAFVPLINNSFKPRRFGVKAVSK